MADETITASQLCTIAGIDPSTLRVWKARWQESEVPFLSMTDRSWSRYTFADTMRVAVLARLAEVGLTVSKLKRSPSVLRTVTHLKAFRDDAAYLVISTGYLASIIPHTPRGAPANKMEDLPKVHLPGELHGSIVRGAEILQVVTDPNRFVSLIINLDLLEQHVKRNWPGTEAPQIGQPD